MAYKNLEPVTGDELHSFHFAVKVTNAKCLRCGIAQWHLLSDARTPANALPTASTEERADIDLFLPLIVLMCQNCGTVWMISRQKFDEWKANKASTEVE